MTNLKPKDRQRNNLQYNIYPTRLKKKEFQYECRYSIFICISWYSLFQHVFSPIKQTQTCQVSSNHSLPPKQTQTCQVSSSHSLSPKDFQMPRSLFSKTYSMCLDKIFSDKLDIVEMIYCHWLCRHLNYTCTGVNIKL